MTQRTITLSLNCLGSSPFIETQYTASPSASSSLSIGNASSDSTKNLTFYYFDNISITRIHGISIYKFDNKGNNITSTLSKLINNPINVTDGKNLNVNVLFRHMIADENSGYYTFYNTNVEDSRNMSSLFKSNTLYNFALRIIVSSDVSRTEDISNNEEVSNTDKPQPQPQPQTNTNNTLIVTGSIIIVISIGCLFFGGIILLFVLKQKK